MRPANKWHTDVTFREKPSFAGILRRGMTPPPGGDTIFADTAAVYADLPPARRRKIGRLKAEHDILQSFGYRVSEDTRQRLREEYPPRAHPMVRTHPETGEKHLFGQPRLHDAHPGRRRGRRGRDLLEYLIDRVKAPEYQAFASAGRPTPSSSGTTARPSTTR